MLMSVMHTVQNAYWGSRDIWRQRHLPDSCQEIFDVAEPFLVAHKPTVLSVAVMDLGKRDS